MGEPVLHTVCQTFTTVSSLHAASSMWNCVSNIRTTGCCRACSISRLILTICWSVPGNRGKHLREKVTMQHLLCISAATLLRSCPTLLFP